MDNFFKLEISFSHFIFWSAHKFLLKFCSLSPTRLRSLQKTKCFNKISNLKKHSTKVKYFNLRRQMAELKRAPTNEYVSANSSAISRHNWINHTIYGVLNSTIYTQKRPEGRLCYIRCRSTLHYCKAILYAHPHLTSYHSLGKGANRLFS